MKLDLKSVDKRKAAALLLALGQTQGAKVKGFDLAKLLSNPLVLALLALLMESEGAAGPVGELPAPPATEPLPPDVRPDDEDEPEPTEDFPQVIFGFSKPKIHNVSEKNKSQPAAFVKSIRDLSGTLSVGQKIHMNSSPIQENGDEYPGYDKRVMEWQKEDGTSPIIEHRWGVGDRELSNSGSDPFDLGSYEPDGCTPALQLTEAIGSDRNKVWFETYVRPEYNGGHEFTSERTYFFAD